MNLFTRTLALQTSGKGLFDCTLAVQDCIHASRIWGGMCHLFLQHTSASLLISENYDPSAKADLQTFLDRLVPEDQSWMQHDDEGPDDSPSHIRAMLTHTSESIPIIEGKLALGTWQGIYIFEHRNHPHQRRMVVQVMGVAAPADPI